MLDSLLSPCHSDSPTSDPQTQVFLLPLSLVQILNLFLFCFSGWRYKQQSFPLHLSPFSFREALTLLFLHHQWPLKPWLCPFSSNINGHVTITLGLQLST